MRRLSALLLCVLAAPCICQTDNHSKIERLRELLKSPLTPEQSRVVQAAVKTAILFDPSNLPFTADLKLQTVPYGGGPQVSRSTRIRYVTETEHDRTPMASADTPTYATEEDLPTQIAESGSGRFLREVLVDALLQSPVDLRLYEKLKRTSDPANPELECYALKEEKKRSICLDPATGLLAKVPSLGALNIFLRSYQPFGSAMVPQTIQVYDAQRLRGTLQIEILERTPNLTASDLDRKTPGIEQVGGPVTPPHLINRVDAQFNEEMRQRKLSGSAILAMVVPPSGIPEQIEMIDAPDPAMIESSVAALSQWRFAPAMRDGRPIPVSINVVINFQIR